MPTETELIPVYCRDCGEDGFIKPFDGFVRIPASEPVAENSGEDSGEHGGEEPLTECE